MEYELSIMISGPGEDPEYRSHWGFFIQEPTELFGDLLHVKVIDLDRLWYQFEPCTGTSIATAKALGMVKIGNLSAKQRQEAIRTISSEPAPKDGRKRCQDWVFDTLLSLEINELVPSGTCQFWIEMVGKSAKAVQEAAGTEWTNFS